MHAQVDIPARFNGPPTSGNGGYSCGVIAAYIDGPARVRLHVPPPLDTPMQIEVAPDGGVEMFDGDTLVGTGSAADFSLEVPAAPSQAQAEDLVDDEGNIPANILWAALDCPGAFAVMGGREVPMVLGQLEAEIAGPVKGGELFVVYSWPLGSEGRKHFAGTAIARASGELVASARSIWIELQG